MCALTLAIGSLAGHAAAQTAAPQMLEFERVLIVGKRPDARPVEVIELPRVLVVGKRPQRQLAVVEPAPSVPKAKG